MLFRQKERGRIARERKTIEYMIQIHCYGQHGVSDTLCSECKELLEHARQRLAKCPFQEKKLTCAKCSVHCYKTAKREQIRQVMRYAGPRMLYKHPVLTLFHLLDGFVRSVKT